MKKIKDIPLEELELMSYDDIAYLVLTETNKKLKINELFKKICDCLNLSEEEYIDKIADFFEILTTDKRFILLKDGYWDLKDRHSEKLVIEDDDEELEEMPEENEEANEENNPYEEETDDDPEEEDLKDLVIIDDEDEEENIM